jgi:hypothetical protein
MAIKFKYRGEPFTADTPEEAVKTLALLKQQDKEAKEAYQERAARYLGAKMEMGGSLVAYGLDELTTPWTPEIFHSFMDRLGESQKAALAMLVTQHRVTDEELRQELGVSGNQALAGILSGISKQAAALGIPARAIFTLENFRNAGQRRSTYAVADKFLHIATDMSWPQVPSEK